jgi:periplasmic divalent cation tolerance protein
MSSSSSRFQVVLTTAGSDEQAETLARALVERRLAACVNIVGQTCSVYRWKGKVEREAEQLLVIKTTADRLPRLREAIRELHSYELPEILALDVAGGDDEYLEWLQGQLAESD